jgi:hypothetical protein
VNFCMSEMFLTWYFLHFRNVSDVGNFKRQKSFDMANSATLEFFTKKKIQNFILTRF